MSIVVDSRVVWMPPQCLDDDSCSSSSIGRNSDVSGGNGGFGLEENEVESEFKGGLDTMCVLEEVLPIKRSISRFYNGKSKSFTSLADASSVSSIKDFAKPENPYTRKRKNLSAHRVICDRNNSYSSSYDPNGVSKKAAISCRSALPIGASTNSSTSTETEETVVLRYHLPPLPPNGCAKRLLISVSGSQCPQQNSPWRSFSLSDVHRAAVTASNN